MTEKVTRLYPLPTRELAAGDLYGDLELPPPRHRDARRPYVVINMVSSIDGKTAVEGKASRIGSGADRRSMRTLRSKADAVMIGAGALRSERLSLGLDENVGVPQPMAVIITSAGDLPLEGHLISREKQEVWVVLSEAASEDVVDRLRCLAFVLRAPADSSGAVDLQKALEMLHAEHGVELLLVEGGPGLNHALIVRNLVDELFLTIAPKLLGGIGDRSPTLLRGGQLRAEARSTPTLLSIHLADSELFLRYSLSRTPPVVR